VATYEEMWKQAMSLAQEAPVGIHFLDLADLIYSMGVTHDSVQAVRLAIDVHPDMSAAEKAAALRTRSFHS
jgi:hypothetical protein